MPEREDEQQREEHQQEEEPEDEDDGWYRDDTAGPLETRDTVLLLSPERYGRPLASPLIPRRRPPKPSAPESGTGPPPIPKRTPVAAVSAAVDKPSSLQGSNSNRSPRGSNSNSSGKRSPRGSNSNSLRSKSPRFLEKLKQGVEQLEMKLQGSPVVARYRKGSFSKTAPQMGLSVVDAPVIKEGYLMKLTLGLSWKRMWVVLRQEHLYFYDSHESATPFGHVNLFSCHGVMNDPREEYCFKVKAGSTDHLMYCSSERDYEDWMHYLLAARALVLGEAGSTAGKRVRARGFLKKQGGNALKDWRQRWCEIEGQMFRYWKTERKLFLLGELNLGMCHIKRDASSSKLRFTIDYLNNRKFLFEAATQEEIDGWIKALQKNANDLAGL